MFISRLEASLCPEVVVAQIDPKKLKKKQTINASVSTRHWQKRTHADTYGAVHVLMIFFYDMCAV